MYADGLSFLEEERDTWRPFEALLELTDEQLEQPVAAAHDWSGRDLMGHLCAWMAWWLDIAREFALGPESASWERLRKVSTEWDEFGDATNAQITAEWRALTIDDVRRRFRETPGELRGTLTVVPETRWIKDAAHLRSLLGNTTEHYLEHEGDLRAILAAAAH
jgi:hypothetical protein